MHKKMANINAQFLATIVHRLIKYMRLILLFRKRFTIFHSVALNFTPVKEPVNKAVAKTFSKG
jgi:hypothetical protein